jgi:signal transduction histidine kinase
MTALFGRWRISLSVAWRLIAGLLPTILAVALVVGLFYYGQAGRQAPHRLLLPAALLTVLSLLITGANVRYFANRIARLAAVTQVAGTEGARVDEFDRIEAAVGSLGAALNTAAGERARVEAHAAEQRRDEATMLAATVADALSQLDGVRLPLQILLEAPFGALNDNQEELLRDARGAADTIETALRRLGEVADADRGALHVQREPVQANDVLRAILPLARAAAERRGARVEMSLEPGLPRVLSDRARLAEALTLLVNEAARAAAEGTVIVLASSRDAAVTRITISPWPAAADPAATSGVILAGRLLSALGARVSFDDAVCAVRVNAEAPRI